MKIGTILVYFAINFFSLSLQNELEIIENVDEIEKPKTLDGVPIDEAIPFNKNIHKTPVGRFSDNSKFDIPEADLRKQSKLTKKVHSGRKSSKVVDDFEDVEDDYVMKKLQREELSDVKKKINFLPINKISLIDKIPIISEVNPRNIPKRKGLFL